MDSIVLLVLFSSIPVLREFAKTVDPLVEHTPVSPKSMDDLTLKQYANIYSECEVVVVVFSVCVVCNAIVSSSVACSVPLLRHQLSIYPMIASAPLLAKVYYL